MSLFPTGCGVRANDGRFAKRVVLVGSLACAPQADGAVCALDAADWLEWRADCAETLAPWAFRRFDECTIYSLRSRIEGGRFNGDAATRTARLVSAAERFAMVELEGERDLIPDLLERIAPSRRLIAWHGPAEDAAALARRFDRYRQVPAALYKLVPAVADAAEALAPLRFARRANRIDLIAYASGASGAWTRLLAPRYGAPLVYGTVGPHPDEPGAGLDLLVADYGLPSLPEVREIYGIVGTTTGRSLSPRLHNAAYRASGRPALYVSFPTESFERFMTAMESGGLTELGLWFGGATVASPHKEAAVAFARHLSPAARACQSANNVRRRDDGWYAGTTDSVGVLRPLIRRGVALRSRRALVVGCGGAGRVVAASFVTAGADVLLMNRGAARARFASRLVGVAHLPLADVDLDRFDLVVNATPVGSRNGEQPFRLRGGRAAAVVVDLTYGQAPTSLVLAARALGAVAIDGFEVLRAQVHEQYRMLTGTTMPESVMTGVLGTPDPPVLLPAAQSL